MPTATGGGAFFFRCGRHVCGRSQHRRRRLHCGMERLRPGPQQAPIASLPVSAGGLQGPWRCRHTVCDSECPGSGSTLAVLARFGARLLKGPPPFKLPVAGACSGNPHWGGWRTGAGTGRPCQWPTDSDAIVSPMALGGSGRRSLTVASWPRPLAGCPWTEMAA